MNNSAKITEVFLPQLMKNGFDIFKSLEDSIRLEQINKVHYIDTIARQLEKNINDVNLFGLFPNKDNIFTCTEIEINKALMSFTPTAAPRMLQKLSAAQKVNINKASNFWNNGIRKNKEKDIIQLNGEIQSYYAMIEKAVVTKNKAKELLGQLTDGDGTILTAQIEQILATKKYKLARVDQEKIVFEMLDNIINTFKNERAGIDLRVDLGKFTLTVFWDGMKSRLGELSDNINNEDYIHPHYSLDGSPCLGTLLEVMDEAQVERDLVKILEINETLLMNYNDDNPYMSLASFAISSKQVQPNGKVLENTNISTDEYEEREIACDQCGAEFTIDFDSDGDYSGECPECDHYESFNYSDL